jgi:protein Tex
VAETADGTGLALSEGVAEQMPLVGDAARAIVAATANAYVKDPRKVAKPGDVVRVKVLEVDPKRRRISLTMRLDEAPGARATAAHTAIAPSGSEKRLRPAETRAGESNLVPASGGGMAEAFRRAGLTGKAPGRR